MFLIYKIVLQLKLKKKNSSIQAQILSIQAEMSVEETNVSIATSLITSG